MSHMVSGRADRWANRELGVNRDGTLCFADWSDFADKFRILFMHPGVKDHALHVIETDSYSRGNETISEYIKRFQDLFNDAGYTDPRYMVTKFR